MTILIFLLILSVLVIIHELGHFLVAKKFGIKVEEFSIGFPPRVWSKKIGETLYSINALPIGGFVKLYGEDEAGAGRVNIPKKQLKLKTSDVWNDDKKAFISRPVWQRAAVVIAGVVMNTLLAIIIFYIFLAMSNFRTHIPLLGDYKFIGAKQTNYNVQKNDLVISEVSKGSPAEKTGLRPPQKIVSVNGKSLKDAEKFTKIVKASQGKEIILGVKDLRTDRDMTISATPRKNPPKGQGALGIAFYPTAVLDYQDPTQKLLAGIAHPINLMQYNMDLLGKIIGFSIKEKTAKPVGDAVAGPIGIFFLFDAYSVSDLKERVMNYLNLAGIISISLAFFNVLPIPALDGGRLFFILIEGITGRKVNQRFEAMAHTIGMAVLLTMILLVTFNDIFRFIIKAP